MKILLNTIHRISLSTVTGLICAVAVLLFSGAEASAITVGVADFDVQDTGLEVKTVSDFFQSELQKKKSITVRDRNTIEDILAHVEKCSSGVIQCGEEKEIDLQSLDVLVFGEFHRHSEGYLLHVRAVNEKNWSVLYTNSITGTDTDEMMQDLAGEVNLKFRTMNQAGSEALRPDSRSKYRIAIHSIRSGNEAAQSVKVGQKLNSILMSSFGKKGRFEVVERSRIQDLLNEKKLSMIGMVQTNRTAFEARGITHYLTGILNVFDGVRVLSYQIINVKTGLPVLDDVIEWTEGSELLAAAVELAETSEEKVFDVNGKLLIEKCDIEGVSVFLKHNVNDTYPKEIGYCPIKIEDIPAGTYQLIFKHPERDTLEKEVKIEAQKTIKLEMITMPPIDMTDFYSAMAFEGKRKYREALLRYDAFIKHYPRHRVAVLSMYRKGFIMQVYLKEYEKGREVLENVLKLKPGADIRSETYYGLALGHRKKGNMEASNRILRMLIDEYSTSTAASAAKRCLDEGNCSL